jgi:hypothetical protein
MDIFENFSADDYKEMRGKIIAMVLATDFSRHFSDLTKFKSKFSVPELTEEGDKLILQEMFMHIADISNPSKPWAFCQKWVDLLFEEYFKLGDMEKDMGLPVSYLCDRKTTVVPSSQVQFINVIVAPCFEAMCPMFPQLKANIDNLESNKAKWQEI